MNQETRRHQGKCHGEADDHGLTCNWRAIGEWNACKYQSCVDHAEKRRNPVGETKYSEADADRDRLKPFPGTGVLVHQSVRALQFNSTQSSMLSSFLTVQATDRELPLLCMITSQ